MKKAAKKPRKRQTVPITPSVLGWAMAEAGYTVETLANALKQVKVSAASIQAWLAGTDQPTLPQFRKLATVLARIPSVFLLPSAPTRVPSPAVEFRHPPEGRDTFNPRERKHIREAARLQEAASWLTGELGEREAALPQVRIGAPAEEAAAESRLRLTGSLNGTFGDRWKSEAQAFQGWRGVLEQSGVFVFVFPLGQKSCRGFSLWNDRAPLIAVNSAWRHSARTFTLFHEYGHLLTRTSSACVEDSPTRAMRNRDPGDPTERWCEHFSAAFLMPREPLLAYLHGSLGWPNRPATLTMAQQVANHFKVSLRAATLRLIEVQAADWSLYSEIPAPSDAKRGGGRAGETRDRGIIKRDQYGQRTVNLFVRALHRDVLARADVLEYLDVTDTHLERFERTG